MNTLDFVDKASLRDDIPAFSPGDTINVHVKVIEGAKERIQVFKGVVLRRQGGGIRETFTVRKDAGAAALAAAHDRARLRRSHEDDLLGPDCAGVRERSLPDPAQDHARRLEAG